MAAEGLNSGLRSDLQRRAGRILAALTRALGEQGVEGVQVIGFEVAPEQDERFEVRARGAAASVGGAAVSREVPHVPCPTVCVRQRDGSIRCYPKC